MFHRYFCETLQKRPLILIYMFHYKPTPPSLNLIEIYVVLDPS